METDEFFHDDVRERKGKGENGKDIGDLRRFQVLEDMHAILSRSRT